jgi:hypothetical protein
LSSLQNAPSTLGAKGGMPRTGPLIRRDQPGSLVFISRPILPVCVIAHKRGRFDRSSTGAKSTEGTPACNASCWKKFSQSKRDLRLKRLLTPVLAPSEGNGNRTSRAGHAVVPVVRTKRKRSLFGFATALRTIERITVAMPLAYMWPQFVLGRHAFLPRKAMAALAVQRENREMDSSHQRASKRPSV